MPIIKRSAIVPHSAAQMYALVNDVNRYQEFLPWCTDSRVLSEDDNQMRAHMAFTRHGITQSVTTQNSLRPGARIAMTCVEGPFHHLDGIWTFEPTDDNGCTIHFALDYALANPVLAMVAGPLFKEITESMVDAFCKRAESL